MTLINKWFYEPPHILEDLAPVIEYGLHLPVSLDGDIQRVDVITMIFIRERTYYSNYLNKVQRFPLEGIVP